MSNELEVTHVRQDIIAEHKPSRKSVSFSDGTTIVDENGDVIKVEGTEEERHTAMSHSSTPPWKLTHDTFNNAY